MSMIVFVLTLVFLALLCRERNLYSAGGGNKSLSLFVWGYNEWNSYCFEESKF